jgi:hypothetical protein
MSIFEKSLEVSHYSRLGAARAQALQCRFARCVEDGQHRESFARCVIHTHVVPACLCNKLDYSFNARHGGPRSESHAEGPALQEVVRLTSSGGSTWSLISAPLLAALRRYGRYALSTVVVVIRDGGAPTAERLLLQAGHQSAAIEARPLAI